MDTLPRTSGIYQILCVPTGKIYIGSAVNLHTRWRGHCTSANRGEHRNPYFQNAWDKYGADAFLFTVIELVLIPFLLEREQYWLDKKRSYDNAIGFNYCHQAGTTLGIRHSDETRLKMRDAARPSHSLEHVEAQATTTRRDYVVISPEKEISLIAGLAQFCRSLGFPHKPLSEVASGDRRSYKGWHCFHADDPEIEQKIAAALTYVPQATEKKQYVVTSPDGTIYSVTGLRAFCREMGLRDTDLLGVASGRRKHSKGWTCKRGDE